MGFWSKFEAHSDSGVCKECEDSKEETVCKALAQVAGVAQTWRKNRDAENWIAKCELLARKYQASENQNLHRSDLHSLPTSLSWWKRRKKFQKATSTFF